MSTNLKQCIYCMPSRDPQAKKKRICKDTRFLVIYSNWNQDMTHLENKLQGCFQWSNILISLPMPLGSRQNRIVKTEMTKKSLKSMKAKFFTFVSLGLLPPPFPLRGSRHSEGAPLLVFHRLWPGRRVRGSWSLWLVAAWWRTLLTCCLYNTIC